MTLLTLLTLSVFLVAFVVSIISKCQEANKNRTHFLTLWKKVSKCQKCQCKFLYRRHPMPRKRRKGGIQSRGTTKKEKEKTNLNRPYMVDAILILVPWGCGSCLRGGLLISLCSIMRLAKHLAVGNIRCAAFWPSCDMVGIHLRQFPYTRTVGVMADGTKRTVGNLFLFGFLRLARINALFGRFIKTTHL